jgi:hypothetical protein
MALASTCIIDSDSRGTIDHIVLRHDSWELTHWAAAESSLHRSTGHHRFQHFLFCCMFLPCRRHTYTTSLPSNGSPFLFHCVLLVVPECHGRVLKRQTKNSTSKKLIRMWRYSSTILELGTIWAPYIFWTWDWTGPEPIWTLLPLLAIKLLPQSP